VFSFMHRHKPSPANLLTSRLYDDRSFYRAFTHDLNRCSIGVVLESPFITERRMSQLYPVIRKAAVRGISFIINTRDPVAHDDRMKAEAYRAVRALQDLDILVLYTSNLHRKVAIIDDSILWEGSLNILSHGGSAEVMRRTESRELAEQMKQHLGMDRFVNGRLGGSHG
jgi:phosphatidylserine/phosphatidylglycerophosphate/cardiolipin synthase-like enzyme